MQPEELQTARHLFKQAELENDPERKFSFLVEALDLTDDLAAENPDSPHLGVLLNLRRSNLRQLLAQLVNMRSLEMGVWFNYIQLLLLRTEPEIKSIISTDPSLTGSYREFMDLWRDELIAALERSR
jgi:hypothetical protein